MSEQESHAAFRGRLLGGLLAGALSAAAAAAAVGFLLMPVGRALTSPGVAVSFRDFLARGGWLWIPLWGAAAGILPALRWAPHRAARLGGWGLALLLAALPLVVRPVVGPEPAARMPVTRLAKTRSIRKWAYGAPASIERVVTISHDPDPVIREQAVLALGLNSLVTDIEHATPNRPARYLAHPLRLRLRARLEQALTDSIESIRAEAARALWNAPLAFGPEAAAGETLAALLDRAARPQALERLSWLALDAAASHSDPALHAAALRFADRTSDTALASAARRALTR